MHTGANKRSSQFAEQLKREVYIPNLVEEREEGRKVFYGKKKQISLGKTNEFPGQLMGDKKVCAICLCRCECHSVFFIAMKFLKRGDLWQLHFSEVVAFSQIREAPRRLLSASVEFQISLGENNIHTYFEVPSKALQYQVKRK